VGLCLFLTAGLRPNVDSTVEAVVDLAFVAFHQVDSIHPLRYVHALRAFRAFLQGGLRESLVHFEVFLVDLDL